MNGSNIKPGNNFWSQVLFKPKRNFLEIPDDDVNVSFETTLHRMLGICEAELEEVYGQALQQHQTRRQPSDPKSSSDTLTWGTCNFNPCKGPSTLTSCRQYKAYLSLRRRGAAKISKGLSSIPRFQGKSEVCDGVFLEQSLLIDRRSGRNSPSVNAAGICEICNPSPVDHGQSSRSNVESETRPVTRSVITNAKRRERREEKKKEAEPPRRAH